MRKRTPERTEMQNWVGILHDSRTVLTMSRVPSTEQTMHMATLFVNSSHKGEPFRLTEIEFTDYAE